VKKGEEGREDIITPGVYLSHPTGVKVSVKVKVPTEFAHLQMEPVLKINQRGNFISTLLVILSLSLVSLYPILNLTASIP